MTLLKSHLIQVNLLQQDLLSLPLRQSLSYLSRVPPPLHLWTIEQEVIIVLQLNLSITFPIMLLLTT